MSFDKVLFTYHKKKSHKAGKPVDYEELPTPPGYAPIPGIAAPEDEPAENFSVPEVKCK